MPPPSFRSITTVSDSLTNTEPDNYLTILGRELGVPVSPEAHGGWTTASYFRERFRGIAFANLAADADLCILLIGSNNLFEDGGGSPVSVEEAVQGVCHIAAYVADLRPGMQFLLAAPPTVCLEKVQPSASLEPRRIDRHTPAMLHRLSLAYRALAAARRWWFVDLFPLLTDADFLDAAHPSPAGNRKIADAMLAVLRP